MTIIRKFEQNTEEKRKISGKIILPVIFVFVFLLIVEIWVNNTLVTYGDKLQNISNLEKTLKMENQILQTEVSSQASLNDIASESAKLGFSLPENIEYIR